MRIFCVPAVALAIAFTIRAEDSARVYVYAQRDTEARSWLSISWDSVKVAELKRGMFFVLEFVPGRHILSVERGAPLPLEVRSGDESFVRLGWNHGANRPPFPILSKIYEAGARREIKFLSYIPAKNAHSNL